MNESDSNGDDGGSPDHGPLITVDVVAREAGVSPSTVSRVLNGTARVSEAKKRSVEAAIAKLGFEPSSLARGLAMGKTNTVGVISQEISSPFYGTALRGIEDHLGALGYMPLFVSGHWTEADNIKCMSLLQRRRVDGIILLTGELNENALLKYSQKTPIVITGHEVSGEQIYSFNLDNLEGARLATSHLIGLGHTRIVCLAGPANHFDARERVKGYRQALAQNQVPFDPQLVISSNFSQVGGMLAMSQLLNVRHDFTAVFACNDQSAYGASLAMYRQGLRIPDDVSIVGFDDLYDSRFTLPPLTSVNISIFEVGKAAATAVVDLIEGRRPKAKAPSAELVVRESTARNLR